MLLSFTKFLGRYAVNDCGPGDPFKTFDQIPRNAASVELTFDFYEIDSWDGLQGDCPFVFINDKQIGVGRFDWHQDENGRYAIRRGVSFSINSQGEPRNIGSTSQWLDQIHHVAMMIPKAYFESDGKLTIKFHTELNEASITS